MDCCGVDKYTDWSSTEWAAQHKNQTVPESCCIQDQCNTNDFKQIHHDGCYLNILQFLSDNLDVIALGLIFIAGFQVN